MDTKVSGEIINYSDSNLAPDKNNNYDVIVIIFEKPDFYTAAAAVALIIWLYWSYFSMVALKTPGWRRLWVRRHRPAWGNIC